MHTQQTTAVINASDRAVITPDQVAKTIAGISVIGHARTVLEHAGWSATITGNRITVCEEVEAQLIPAKTGTTYGPIAAQWVVSVIDGSRPVWVVGTEVRS